MIAYADQNLESGVFIADMPPHNLSTSLPGLVVQSGKNAPNHISRQSKIRVSASRSESSEPSISRIYEPLNEEIFVLWPTSSGSDTALYVLGRGIKSRVKQAISKIELLERKAQDDSRYSRLASQESMLFIEANFQKRSPESLQEVNLFLHRLDVELLSSISLVGIFRSTYRFAEQLPVWRVKYNTARRRIRALGKDPYRLFVGLPD